MAVIPTFAANDVLTAANMNLVATAAQQGSRNAIINGAFDIWQRGTSFGSNVYSADRWIAESDGTSTATRQTFSPGAAPLTGLELAYFLRMTRTSGGTYIGAVQRVESVRTFAGQTVTLSFYAKAASAITLSSRISQNFGTGGSAEVTSADTSFSLTTDWQRFTVTSALPSISGKTIGTNDYLKLLLFTTALSVAFDITGVQLEAGSVATPFKRNAPSIQAELAACQRYYWRVSADASTPYNYFGHATAGSSTTLRMPFYTKTSLRTFISSVEWGGNITATTGNGSTYAITNIAIDAYSKEVPALVLTVASGLTTNTTYIVRADNSVTAYIGLPAEL